MHPGTASFIIPSSLHYVCDYALQNELEHIVQTIVLSPNSEFMVDLILRPSLGFDTTETAFGCDYDLLGYDYDLFAKPYAFEYCSKFIVAGHRRNVIPGFHDRYDDYIDKHHYYHTVENSRFNAGDVKAMGFKIRTLCAGTYNMKIFFSGSTVSGEFRGLTIVVSDAMPDLMRCVDPNHQQRDCAVRIRPRMAS